MGEQRIIEYRAPDGMHAELVVDWPVGEGRIPPPSIVFYDGQLDMRIEFVYCGEREAAR
jgi:hypothetical protein